MINWVFKTVVGRWVAFKNDTVMIGGGYFASQAFIDGNTKA